MDLKLENIEELSKISDEYPKYDVNKLREISIKDPKWLAVGSGNIFRAYIAKLNQELINKEIYDRGISVLGSSNSEVVEKVYRDFDNLSLSVTLNNDGNFNVNLLGNIVEVLDYSEKIRLEEIIKNKNLELISFIITEKGYNLLDLDGNPLKTIQEDIDGEPDESKNLMSIITNMLYKRFKDSKAPIALVAMDNVSKNGDVLKSAITFLAKAWIAQGKMDHEFMEYLEDEIKVSFPWTMIDKITPGSAKVVEEFLLERGFTNISPVKLNKGGFRAPFVNSEEAEYLAIEDKFPNGRPSLEEVGVIMTDKETVEKLETMKVTACLNPLHTALAVYGCLLGYDSISTEMKDDELLGLVKGIGYGEAIAVVEDPKVIKPEEFLDEVINIRFPNPYIPDMPQRISTDTSQKIPIRFGKTIEKYWKVEDKDQRDLKYIPLAIAGWLRYLLGVDDEGREMELSPDPLMTILKEAISGIELGRFEPTEKLYDLLENEVIFGVNLVEVGLSEKILKYFKELSTSTGSVRKTLKKYTQSDLEV